MADVEEVKIPDGFALFKGETPIWYGKPNWSSFWLWIIIGLLTFVILIGILILIAIAIMVYSSEYFVTNKRIYAKYGLISRETYEIKREFIMGTSIRQDFAGRILNYGSLVFDTPGQYGGRVVMANLSNPLHIRTLIEDSNPAAPKITKILANQDKSETIAVSESSENGSLEILKERYAKGEITEDQFEKMKKNIE